MKSRMGIWTFCGLCPLGGGLLAAAIAALACGPTLAQEGASVKAAQKAVSGKSLKEPQPAAEPDAGTTTPPAKPPEIVATPPDPATVMNPDAKWACDNAICTLEPIWRAEYTKLTFNFAIRNVGTADLIIKAQGG